ncbi:9174_t:CDS:2 [Paraglomus brasilianum]|uniref:9174_t:CDS:1 n=1 Tax=Paraglomus brasilianum TaxID=144538 RepID=A0A9N9G6C0_9GLOM|nr:9174_t:CDS:2 [Paraglomus brasilianum]
MSWVHLEVDEELCLVRLEADAEPCLADLVGILVNRFECLQSVKEGNIKFLLINTGEPLSRAMKLRDLETADTSPLIVRYPLSNDTVHLNLRCYISTSWTHLRISHTQLEIKGEELKGEFEFNDWLNDIPSNNNKRIVNVLIKIEGPKFLEENLMVNGSLMKLLLPSWECQRQIWDIRHFSKDDIPKHSWDISDLILSGFTTELRRKMEAFGEFVNEPTVREFISPFMTTAVVIGKKTNSTLRVVAKDNLKGSRGYGPVDFTVHSDDIIILVTGAKNEDLKQGVGQNYAQMHSAVECLEKKGKITEDDKYSVVMYGVVTTGSNWIFNRWIGMSKHPMIERTDVIRNSWVYRWNFRVSS